MRLRKKANQGMKTDFAIWGDGALVIGTGLCAPANEELKR